MRQVLIFAHECAPYNGPQCTVGAQRPAQFAKHLPAFGWRAIVLCCDALRRGLGTPSDLERVPALVRAGVERARPDESIVIATASAFDDGLVDRCWRRLLPAEGATGNGWKALARKPLTAAKFLTGDYSQAWQPFARRAAETIAAEIRIDACLGEHGPDAGLHLARWFADRYEVPWVADFRDPILQPLTPLARRLYAPVARRLLRSVAATVNVAPVWAEMDARRFGCRACSISNGFDPDEFPRVAAAPHNTRFTIAYAGNIIGAQRIEMFLDGLAVLQRRDEGSSELLFKYRGNAWERVARMAAARNLDAVVDIRPQVPRPLALSELTEADLLLVLSVADVGRQDEYLRHGVCPAKTFECFGARRPILCVPGDAGLLDALLTETGTGVVRRSPAEVADDIAERRRHWRAGRPVPFVPNEEAVASYTRRRQAGQLAELLQDVAAGR